LNNIESRIAYSFNILKIPVDASVEDIKRAFRRRAKDLHPDLDIKENVSDSAMKELIIAYRMLLEWKKQYQTVSRTPGLKEEEKFDYREFLRNRPDDLSIQAKLIFYDLLHGYEEEAIDLYRQFFAFPDEDRNLERYMDREDYMDCAFLLAEEFESRGDLITAFRMLIRISELEYQAPYFKHFMEEVLLRLRLLTCIRMNDRIPAETQVECLHTALGKKFAVSIRSDLCKRLAEIYAGLDLLDEAKYYLDMCLLYQPKMSGIKNLKKRILCS
jgi:hypothetical protein